MLLPLIIATLLAGAEARAAGPADSLVGLVRTLQTLQDRIARGSVASRSAQHDLIDLIAKRFVAAAPESWSASANIGAATLYLLIGGDPIVAPPILAARGVAAADAALFKAALASALGRQADAQALWAAIDVAGLGPVLAGPAALVKANLLMDADPSTAMRLLDEARLAAPGTLVEEAAIRRSVGVAAKLGDARKFEFLAVSFARRFPRSAYASGFRRNLAQSYLALADAGSPASLARLEAMLAPLPVDDKRRILLDVGRLALVAGATEITAFVSARARKLAPGGDSGSARATLYQAAAGAVTGLDERARSEIRSIETSGLDSADLELREATLEVVRQIERWPDVPSSGPQPPVDPAKAAASLALNARVLAALDAAQSLLAETSH